MKKDAYEHKDLPKRIAALKTFIRAGATSDEHGRQLRRWSMVRRLEGRWVFTDGARAHAERLGLFGGAG